MCGEFLSEGPPKVGEGLPEAAVLLRELADFRVTITANAHEMFGAGSNGRHDLVQAVTLALSPATGR
jgi:hypothetical protein